MSAEEKESLIGRTPSPRTRASLAHDLASLGIAPGMTLIVHASLARIGLVVGDAPAVIHALMDALGPAGTLMMPTFSGGLTDPATWREPPVPQEWHDFIRANMLPFDAARTPTRLMGQIAERTRCGSVLSVRRRAGSCDSAISSISRRPGSTGNWRPALSRRCDAARPRRSTVRRPVIPAELR